MSCRAEWGKSRRSPSNRSVEGLSWDALWHPARSQTGRQATWSVASTWRRLGIKCGRGGDRTRDPKVKSRGPCQVGWATSWGWRYDREPECGHGHLLCRVWRPERQAFPGGDESGWCSDVASTHGAWRHAGVRFLLRRACGCVFCPARTSASSGVEDDALLGKRWHWDFGSEPNSGKTYVVFHRESWSCMLRCIWAHVFQSISSAIV